MAERARAGSKRACDHADIGLLIALVGKKCDRLRETAEQLRAWARRVRPESAEHEGEVNPWHAAMRIEQIADEISKSSKSKGKRTKQ